MKKKSFLALFLVAAMLFCACGGKQADNVSTESVASEDEASQMQENTDKKVELTVWGAEEDQALLAQIVDSFKQEYAKEAEFEITIAVESESSCKDTLLGDIANGADVFAFADDQLMSMVAAGVLAPVPNADEIKARNVEGAVAASTVNETLYAYPMTADNGYFMYYNKAYFTEEDIKTLDGMLAVAAANGKKIAMDWTSGWYLYSFFGATGLTVGLNEDGISNYCTWNATDGAIKGVDVANAMLSISANPAFGSMGDTDFVAGARDDSVIAGVGGVWLATEIEKIWGANYGAVKLPTYTCAGQQVQMASFTGYKMVGANAYSEHVDWALKLADWITNEDNQMLRYAQRGLGPSNIKASETPEIASSPAIGALLEQAEFGSLQRIGGKYWDPVSAFGVEMINGNPSGRSLQEMLDQMVEEMTAAI